MECPFVFSSSAEIPVFCPCEQCPLHVFSLEVVSPETLPAGTFIAWRFSGNSTKVTVFPKNTWTDTPLSSFPLPFVCPYLLSSCFIYLFIFLSFFHTVLSDSAHSGGAAADAVVPVALHRAWVRLDSEALVRWSLEIRQDLVWWWDHERLELVSLLGRVSPQLDLWSDSSDVG